MKSRVGSCSLVYPNECLLLFYAHVLPFGLFLLLFCTLIILHLLTHPLDFSSCLFLGWWCYEF